MMNFSIPRFNTAFKTASVIAVVSIGITSCASQEPQLAAPSSQTVPVVVGYVAGDAEQEVLAQVYAHGFTRVQRAAGVIELPDAKGRIDAVRNHLTTVGFGCTGELLGIFDPERARQLSDEYRHDNNPAKVLDPQWRDRVYAAFSESLPGTVMATDPSNVQGCEDVDENNPGATLPQHVVPFYGKPALTRRDRVEVLNRIAGSLTEKDLKSMMEKKKSGESSESIAQDWVETSRFATG